MVKRTITKECLADDLQKNIGLSKMLCEELVNELFNTLYVQTKDKSSVTIKNLGRFFLNKKNARPGVNLQNGDSINIPSRTVLRFVPSRSFKNHLK